MKIGRLKLDIKPAESGPYTFNGHHIDKNVQYIILSENSGVINFPIVMQHPVYKQILLVDQAGVDFL